MAAWVPDVFYNFYLVKNYKKEKNSTTAKASEKISTDLESLEFWKKNWCIFHKIKKNYLIILATDFYWQPSYLLGERSSLLLQLVKAYHVTDFALGVAHFIK